MGTNVLDAQTLNERPEAVLFDLDNTLYDYDLPHNSGTAAVRQKVKRALRTSDEAFDRAFAQARDEVKRRLGSTASAHSRLLYFQRTIEVLGFGTQPLLSLDLEQTYWRSFLSAASLLPDAEETLIDLRAAGVPLALVTDLTAQIQFRKILHFGLERYFDAIVTSEEAGSDKIGQEPFRIALEKLRLAASARVWMIGDSAADITTAKDTINACALQRCTSIAGAPVHRGADVVFDTFASLRQVINARPWMGGPGGANGLH